MALTVACAHCSGLGAACVSFGTGRSAHAFILSPLVPVVGVLCSAQSHAIPAASRFFILAPSGPCERQLRCTERPLLASQPHTPAPGEIHLSPSFWYTTAHGTFFLSFSVKCDIFWLFRAHGGNFLSFKHVFKKKTTEKCNHGPCTTHSCMMGPAQHFTTTCSHGVLPVSLTP